MPKLRNAIPSYCLHKQSGRGMSRLSGKDKLFPGPHGSPESRAAYDQFVAQWLANGRRLPGLAAPALSENVSAPTVDEILLKFLDFARAHYADRGSGTSEVSNLKDAIRPLQKLFGTEAAREIGPKRLKTIQAEMIGSGLSRPGINARVRRIIRVFRWAASEELIPAEVYHGLKTVQGLQRGRTAAGETEPVRPVADAFVDAIRDHVSRQVWAMVELQRLTGARPGEIVLVRTRDLETSGKVWVYRPMTHKTAYRGRDRAIYLGPAAQAILRPWLRTQLDEFLFQPQEAEAERLANLRANRKSKVQPSQRDRSRAGTTQKPGERYDSKSYARAILRGCDKADVPHWSPHRLRHSAATKIRKEFGLDVTRAILGHASVDVTEIYAERDSGQAIEAMARIG